jgi:hypothetical protein
VNESVAESDFLSELAGAASLVNPSTEAVTFEDELKRWFAYAGLSTTTSSRGWSFSSEVPVLIYCVHYIDDCALCLQMVQNESTNIPSIEHCCP